MWSVKQTAQRPRLVAALVMALLVLASGTGCTHAKPKKGSDPKAMNTVAAQIQTTLAQRPEVAKAEVNYQDTVDASGTAAVSVTVKPGADLDPIVDSALQLIWQSKLNPLDYIRVGVIDANDLQRGTVRNVDPVKQKAELDQKYGPHPTK